MNKEADAIIIVGLVFVLSIVALNVNASPIVHEFKNPSFSGIGASAHYLTIDEQETKRRDELALSRDISDMLFSEDGGTGGTIELEGNSISFSNDGEYITLTVIDENGTITEIVIPIGVFGVCTSDCGV